MLPPSFPFASIYFRDCERPNYFRKMCPIWASFQGMSKGSRCKYFENIPIISTYIKGSLLGLLSVWKVNSCNQVVPSFFIISDPLIVGIFEREDFLENFIFKIDYTNHGWCNRFRLQSYSRRSHLIGAVNWTQKLQNMSVLIWTHMFEFVFQVNDSEMWMWFHKFFYCILALAQWRWVSLVEFQKINWRKFCLGFSIIWTTKICSDVKLCAVNGEKFSWVKNRGENCSIGRSFHLHSGVKFGGTLYTTRINCKLHITGVFAGPSFKN